MLIIFFKFCGIPNTNPDLISPTSGRINRRFLAKFTGQIVLL